MNELTRRRWKHFFSNKRAVVATVFLGLITFFSFTAELWANNKPWILRVNNAWYFPVLFHYHPTEFGLTDTLVTDYRKLSQSPHAWALWPVIDWDPFEKNDALSSYPAPPSRQNWLGTDDRGRDILTRLLYGYRMSILYSVSVWALSAFFAVLLGGAMGYWGGWVDLVGQRVVEVLSSIPVLFLLIILVSMFPASLPLLIILSALFGWIGLSYFMRGEFLKNRKREYVEAARAMGASQTRLIFRHILPNSLIPIITYSPFMIAGHIYGLAALDYLGFGLPAPTPSWGELLNQAQKNFTTAWWLALFPSLALFSTLVLLGVIGDGIRGAFDPRKG